jgi:hypothetical protein
MTSSCGIIEIRLCVFPNRGAVAGIYQCGDLAGPSFRRALSGGNGSEDENEYAGNSEFHTDRLLRL